MRPRMSLLIRRTVFVPIWCLVIAFVALSPSPPGPVATVPLLLFSGLAVLTITILRKPAAHARGTHGLPTIDVWPPPARAPFSWPDSGFRNIGRGTKGG